MGTEGAGGSSHQTVSTTFHRCWLTEEVPVDWKLTNVMLIYWKGRKEDPRNYGLVSLTSVLGMVIEQVTLSTRSTGQSDDEAQSACVYERQVLLD